jgi:hypothetical protein
MPVAAPIVAAIITAATAATETGLQLSGALTPDSPRPSTTPSPLTANQNKAQQAAVSQQFPNIQSLTGGSLSPEYWAQQASSNAGLNNDPQATGNVQAALNQIFQTIGLSAPGQTGLTSSAPSTTGGGGTGSPGILEMLQKPSSLTTNSPLTGGGGMQGWIQQQLQGNSFQGLAG